MTAMQSIRDMGLIAIPLLGVFALYSGKLFFFLTCVIDFGLISLTTGRFAQDDAVGIFVFATPVLMVQGYFLPTILASVFGCSSIFKIIVGNTLLGWTGIGWVLMCFAALFAG
jgi:hypothetical protein